jgi:hypothetical protein
LIVCLDIATKCGWAQWHPSWAKPIYGTWDFSGVDAGEVGRRCIMLHRKLADLHAMCGIERLNFEGGVPSNGFAGNTNMTTLYTLAALAGHAESFAYAVGARCRNVPQARWRKHFVGKGSGFKTKEFKALSMTRCRSLDWHPSDDNAADALGVLDYTIHLAGITPPWLEAAAFGRAQV